jgi:sulfur relay (sulfurtransferase) complex TusBCD TusD component (DsrE family)
MHQEKKQRLGILLTTSPESENTFTVIKLTEAAVSQGKEVRIFLMCDGVHNINNPDFTSLLDKGATITLCAHNASERHVEKKEGINFGSQYDLAYIVNESDKFLSFT